MERGGGWLWGGGGGEDRERTEANRSQYGGSPVKVGEEEYALFRDYELLAKINE